MRYILFTILVLLFVSCGSPQKTSATDSILGDWFGESKCVGNNPSCHDEVVVYHLTRSKTDLSKIHLSADKIVNGKPDFMGEFDFVYDDKKGILTTEFKIPRTGGTGVWSFTVDDDKMTGTLTSLPENEVSRRVTVSRKTKP